MKPSPTIDEQRKANSERNARKNDRSPAPDQAIQKDQRGQEQPADKKRAQENR